MTRISQSFRAGLLLTALAATAHAQDGNTLSGLNAGSNITSGDRNTVIGDEAGFSLTSGGGNVLFGYEAVYNTSTNFGLIAIGYRAGYSTTNIVSIDGTFVGFEAGWNNTSGVDNTFFGSESGELNTTGSRNVFLGEEAGAKNTTGSDNLLIGEDALPSNTTGSRYVVIGNSAGGLEDAGYGSIYIGDDAIKGSSGGNNTNNVYVGSQSGYAANGGVANVALGAFSGGWNDFADFNVFVGAYAGLNNNRRDSTTLANRNTFVGMAAGYSNQNGEDNVAIGAFAGFDDLSSVSNDVTAFQDVRGFDHSLVAFSNKTSSRQTVVGSLATTLEDNSMAIGYGASSQATGAIALGNQALAAPTHDNAIVIGNGGASQGANIMVLGNDTLTGISPGSDGTVSLGASGMRYSVATAEAIIAQADAGADAQIEWLANDGSNPADQWQLKGNNGGSLELQTFATSSFANAIALSHAGELTINGDLIINSDRELKHRIADIEEALSLVMDMEGRAYEWRPELGRSAGRQYGFVAQEVAAVLPELVTTHDISGIKSVNYQAVLPILVDAVNEQQNQLDERGSDLGEVGKINEIQNQLTQQGDQIALLQAELAKQQAQLEKWRASREIAATYASSPNQESDQ